MTWIFSLDNELVRYFLVRCGQRPRWAVRDDPIVNPLKFYTANLAAFLTVKRMDSPINNAEDKGSTHPSRSVQVDVAVRESLLKIFQNKSRLNTGRNLMVRLLLFSKILKFQLIKKCGRQWLNENQIQKHKMKE